MTALVTAVMGAALGLLLGLAWRPKQPPQLVGMMPIEADAIEVIAPNHNTCCIGPSWPKRHDERSNPQWQCSVDCPHNLWRIENANRPIAHNKRLELPQATVVPRQGRD